MHIADPFSDQFFEKCTKMRKLLSTVAHKCHAENHESRHNTPNSRHNTTSSRHNTAETHGTTHPKLTARHNRNSRHDTAETHGRSRIPRQKCNPKIDLRYCACVIITTAALKYQSTSKRPRAKITIASPIYGKLKTLRFCDVLLNLWQQSRRKRSILLFVW